MSSWDNLLWLVRRDFCDDVSKVLLEFRGLVVDEIGFWSILELSLSYLTLLIGVFSTNTFLLLYRFRTKQLIIFTASIS